MWILYASICSVLWGFGYTLLKLISLDISPYMINFLYGIVLTISNLTAIFITGGFTSNGFYSFGSLKSLIGLIGYILCFTVSSFIYLYGYLQVDTPPGVYTAITSTYVIISFFGALVLSAMGLIPEIHINLYTTIPGMLMITGGVILLVIK
jgi:drug/metabolite transporter (DMT)-like permease